MKYRAYSTEGEYVDLTEEMNVSPKAGEEYAVKLDLDEKLYYPPTLVNGNKSRAIDSKPTYVPQGNSIHLRELK